MKQETITSRHKERQIQQNAAFFLHQRLYFLEIDVYMFLSPFIPPVFLSVQKCSTPVVYRISNGY